MGLVHVGLDLEHEGREIVLEGRDLGGVSIIYGRMDAHVRQGGRGHLQKSFKEGLHTEVVQRGAEEYGGELAATHLFNTGNSDCHADPVWRWKHKVFPVYECGDRFCGLFSDFWSGSMDGTPCQQGNEKDGRVKMEEKNVFEYRYSAKQQEEVDAIRKKYLPKEEKAKGTDKLEELKQLDQRVELTATIWAIAVGVIGTLTFGAGMSLIMAFETAMYLQGIIVGIIGIAGIALALPVYRIVLKKQREKMAPKILALTEELSKN